MHLINTVVNFNSTRFDKLSLNLREQFVRDWLILNSYKK